MISILEVIEDFDNLIVWHANEDEYALEAWERMTDGGVNGLESLLSPSLWSFTVGRQIMYATWVTGRYAAR